MKRPPYHLIPSKRQYGDAFLVQCHHSTTHNITFLRSGAFTPETAETRGSECGELLSGSTAHNCDDNGLCDRTKCDGMNDAKRRRDISPRSSQGSSVLIWRQYNAKWVTNCLRS
eukprot:scaffold3217_cov71-Skeletonema_menzelii.AAC.1